VSVKPTPVNVVDGLGLLRSKLSDVDPFNGMLAKPKDLAIVGGPTTVTLAEAVPPGLLSLEVTLPVVLFFVPALVPVTFTLKVHEIPEVISSVAPDKLMAPDPAFAVTVPPPQVPVRPFGVETTRPAGSVSVKPIPVKIEKILGLVTVKLSEVEPFSGTLPAPKDLAIVGGADCAHAPPEIRHKEASMQPRRIRQRFMKSFGAPGRRTLGVGCMIRRRQHRSRAYRWLTVPRKLTVVSDDSIVSVGGGAVKDCVDAVARLDASTQKFTSRGGNPTRVRTL